MDAQLAASANRFPQTYQHFCAKLNDSEIFVMSFGKSRAIVRSAFFDALRMAMIQCSADLQS
jgi:hypothetical protein